VHLACPQSQCFSLFLLFINSPISFFQEVDPTETWNVEDADLHVSDYFLIWTGGDDQGVCVEGIIQADSNDDGTTEVVVNYQNKLTWNEIILDDFS
jgi:hypothetical protein